MSDTIHAIVFYFPERRACCRELGKLSLKWGRAEQLCCVTFWSLVLVTGPERYGSATAQAAGHAASGSGFPFMSSILNLTLAGESLRHFPPLGVTLSSPRSDSSVFTAQAFALAVLQ